MGPVDLLAGVDLEGDVLDADLVVAVGAAIRRPDPDPRVPELEVDDLLGPSVGVEPRVLAEAERAEDGVVEGQRSIDVGDGQVHVLDPDTGHVDDPSGQRARSGFGQEGDAVEPEVRGFGEDFSARSGVA